MINIHNANNNDEISLGFFLTGIKNKLQNRIIKEREILHPELLSKEHRRIQETEKHVQNLKSLFEQAKYGITIIQDWVLKYVNPSLSKILGYTVEDMLNTPFINFVHPDVLPELIDRYKRRISGQKAPLSYKTKLIKKDGKLVDVEINAGLISYRKKPADLVYITKCNPVEDYFHSEKKYQIIVEKLQEGVLLEDLEGIISFVNPRMAEMLGYSTKDLLGKHWTSIVPTIEIDRIKKQTFQRRYGVCNSYESSLKSKDGKIIPVIVTANPIFIDSESFQGILTVFTDITERKQAEMALLEAKDKFQNLIENTEVGIISINEDDGKILFYNQKVASLLSYSPEQLNSMTLFDLIFQNDLDIVKKAVRKKKNDTEFRAIKENGELIWLKMKISPMGKLGIITQIQCFLWDINQEKTLQELQDCFIETTNHELRTPVTVIKGYIDFLRITPRIPLEKKNQIYNILARNVDRLIKLIDSVHDFSSIRNNTMEISRDFVNLDEFVQDLNEELPTLYPKRSVFLNYYIIGDTPLQLRFDQNRILQVIYNLVSNSIKHSPNDSIIGITVIKNSKTLQICVEDQGIGISQNTLSKLFQPFSHNASRYSTTGMGLGLYLVKTIVNAHQGTLKCETQLDVGSIFDFTIPIR
ncbi:MAG: PAS domain-containing sensor histidine kinase [Candidatus Heimdallarchaeota archaeon]|nr:MAG: PAS domain-containing sensor histidine kinase [Candidatus Heimdallarchaeota archaeon]